MKKLEELGISPAPWKCTTYIVGKTKLGEIRTLDGFKIGVDLKKPDALIEAAAPDLYKSLWELLFGDKMNVNCRVCKGAELGNCKDCDFGKAREALAKASGEETSNG